MGRRSRPEEQSGVEVGADLFYGRFLSLHATRFDQRASGLIQPVSVYQPVTDTVLHYKRIVYELQNVGEISNRGWELQSKLGNGPWSVGATFSQVDSKCESSLRDIREICVRVIECSRFPSAHSA